MAESYSDNKISFSEDAYSADAILLTAATTDATTADDKKMSGRVNSETWEPLEKLAKGEVS